MLNALIFSLAITLLVVAVAIRKWSQISSAWARVQVFRADLAAREVDRERAAEVLWVLRACFHGLAVLALLVVGIFVYRWPEAKAQALRLRYQRMIVTQRLNVRLWQEGHGQLLAVVAKIEDDPALTSAEKYDELSGIEPVFLAISARLRRSGITLGQLLASEKTVPERIWPWTPVADPETTITARAGATPEEIEPYIERRLVQASIAQRWIDLVAATSQPGADPLPPPTEWENL